MRIVMAARYAQYLPILLIPLEEASTASPQMLLLLLVSFFLIHFEFHLHEAVLVSILRGAVQPHPQQLALAVHTDHHLTQELHKSDKRVTQEY
jgi:hypothetical protein